MSNFVIVEDPGNGADIMPYLKKAEKLVSDRGGKIAFHNDRNYIAIGVLRTTKSFHLTNLTEAFCTFEYGQFSWNPGPTTVIRRSELTSDSSIYGLPFIEFVQNNDSPCGIKVSDIEFRSKEPSYTGAPTAGIPATDGKSLAQDYGLRFIKCVDFQVTRCIFKYFGLAAISVRHWDHKANGLIYKCHFYRNAKGWDGCGSGYGIHVYGEDIVRQIDPEYGSKNFVIIEDCRSDWHRHFVGCDGNGKYVLRFCYDYENNISIDRVTHTGDSHSGRKTYKGSGNYHSTRAFEIYNTRIIHKKFWSNTGNGDLIVPGLGKKGIDKLIKYGIACRGGSCIIYNNRIEGTQYAIGLYLENKDTSAEFGPLSTDPMWMKNNTFIPYTDLKMDGFPLSDTFINLNDGIINPVSYPKRFIKDIHYKEEELPNYYKRYKYPHPDRDDLV